MKIVFGTMKDPLWSEINLRECDDVIIRECYNGVGMETDQGRFDIAMRDDGIEVMLDGKLVWTSMTLKEESVPKSGNRSFKITGEYSVYDVSVYGDEFIVKDGSGEEVGHGAISEVYGAISEVYGVEWVSMRFHEDDFDAVDSALRGSV